MNKPIESLMGQTFQCTNSQAMSYTGANIAGALVKDIEWLVDNTIHDEIDWTIFGGLENE